MKYFETRFLEEAKKFIAGLDSKTAKKVFYNIDVAEQMDIPEHADPSNPECFQVMKAPLQAGFD